MALFLFHGKRHPAQMDKIQLEAFLTKSRWNLGVTMIYTHVLNRGGRGVRQSGHGVAVPLSS